MTSARLLLFVVGCAWFGLGIVTVAQARRIDAALQKAVVEAENARRAGDAVS